LFEDMSNKIECNYCGKTIFPFSVYLDMDREGLIVFCNKDCLNNWYQKEIEDTIDEFNNH